MMELFNHDDMRNLLLVTDAQSAEVFIADSPQRKLPNVGQFTFL
jgi:hypothetical protein